MPEQGGVEQTDSKLRNGNEKGPSPIAPFCGRRPRQGGEEVEASRRRCVWEEMEPDRATLPLSKPG